MRCTRLLLVCLATAVALPAQNRDRRRRNFTEPELENLIHREGTFASAAVDKEMPYGIYLPKAYDDEANKDRQWPLVIWLHGMWEDHKRFHLRGGAPVLDKAVGDGLLPPCIFVLANGGRTSMYINKGPKRNWQDLVQKDLLEHITATYRVLESRDCRALMGISMGGMTAMRIGFTTPLLYGTIATHSAAVFPPDPKQLSPRLLQRASQFGLDEVFGNPIDEKLWAQTNPLGIAVGMEPATLDGLRIYFDAGTDDYLNFGDTNGKLHELLLQKKIEHSWTLVKGGGHAWGSGFKDESLLASLKFVGAGFQAAAKADAKGESKPETGPGK